MNYREEQFMKQMTEIAVEVAELRAENKLLKSFNDSLTQALHKPVVSGKQPVFQLCPKCFGEGRSEQLAAYLQDIIGKKYSIYFEQQDIDGLIEAANCH